MTREELEMRKLVRESDVIDKTDGSELARAFNHLWEKYIEHEPIICPSQGIDCEDCPAYDPRVDAIIRAEVKRIVMENCNG